MTDPEEINITDAETGESRTGRRRRGAQMMKNGYRSNDYVQSAIRTYDYIKAAALMLSAVGAVLWGIVEWVAVPQMERIVREAVAPINAKTSELSSHVANLTDDLASRTGSRWTLIDQRLYMNRIRALNRELHIPEPEHQLLPGEAY